VIYLRRLFTFDCETDGVGMNSKTTFFIRGLVKFYRHNGSSVIANKHNGTFNIYGNSLAKATYQVCLDPCFTDSS